MASKSSTRAFNRHCVSSPEPFRQLEFHGSNNFIVQAVVEMFGSKTVWEGVVESFALIGHPKAKRCYAWSYQDNGETQYINVLEIPPVVSPQTAVRAAIASGSQK
jgi:hypothetical protein